MWFNKDTKDRFLETIEESQYPIRYWQILFETISVHEEMLEKDIFNFSKKQIITMYKLMNHSSYETLMVTHLNLKKYLVWAMQNNLVIDGQDHFDEITSQELFGCINQIQLQQSIITRDEVISIVRKMTNYQDRFMVLGVFEGIKGNQFNDLAYATWSDFDTKNCTMHLYSGRTISVSRELLGIAEVSSKTFLYTMVAKDGSTSEHELYGDGIIKVLKKRHNNGFDISDSRQIYHVITKALDEFGYGGVVSSNSLYTSGVIHMVNELAEQHNMTGREVLYDAYLFEQIRQQYGFNPLIRKRFVMKYEFVLK